MKKLQSIGEPFEAFLNLIFKTFKDWILYGQANFEDLIEDNFTKVDDWEVQLKFLKHKRRELDKIPK